MKAQEIVRRCVTVACWMALVCLLSAMPGLVLAQDAGTPAPADDSADDLTTVFPHAKDSRWWVSG
jgi:hypothetical protein